MNLVKEGRHTVRSLVWVENSALSPRELEILHLVAEGHSNQAIADLLVIDERTVRSHVSHLIGKLGAKNRTHAVCIAYQVGYLRPPYEPQTARQAVALAAYYASLANVLLQREGNTP